MTGPCLPLHIAADHPAYAGHFPGNPILPGVALLDEALHRLAAHEGLDFATGKISSAKFPSPIRPGEPLLLYYAAKAAGVFHFEVVTGERVAASGTIAFTATHPVDGAP